MILPDGMKGRIGLFEVMEITDDLRDLVLAGAPAARLRQAALEFLQVGHPLGAE